MAVTPAKASSIIIIRRRLAMEDMVLHLPSLITTVDTM